MYVLDHTISRLLQMRRSLTPETEVKCLFRIFFTVCFCTDPLDLRLQLFT